MSPVADMINVSAGKRSFETAAVIEITKNTIKFGSSVYQSRNLTGVTVSSTPKQKFLLYLGLILIVTGFLSFALAAVLGCFLLALAIFLLFAHFNQSQLHGLRFFLNSGQEILFLNNNKSFMIEIVEDIYRFIETENDLAMVIDQSTSTITYY